MFILKYEEKPTEEDDEDDEREDEKNDDNLEINENDEDDEGKSKGFIVIPKRIRIDSFLKIFLGTEKKKLTDNENEVDGEIENNEDEDMDEEEVIHFSMNKCTFNKNFMYYLF